MIFLQILKFKKNILKNLVLKICLIFFLEVNYTKIKWTILWKIIKFIKKIKNRIDLWRKISEFINESNNHKEKINNMLNY